MVTNALSPKPKGVHLLGIKGSGIWNPMVFEFLHLNNKIDDSLFFISGHIRGTCHIYRWWLQVIFLQFMNMSLHNSTNRYRKSDLPVVNLHELMSCLCPHNEAAILWRVVYCYWPWSIVNASCVVNRDCVIIYHHAALDGNKLVQLRGLSTIC
jgi:hypothetical protein